MGFLSILSFAHQLVEQRVKPGDTVVDATMGNGNDTLFLAKCVGPAGVVHGFDIQQQAVERTSERLNKELASENCPKLEYHLRSHSELLQAIPDTVHGQISAVMFNLGYLPKADHTVITQPESTIPALDASLQLLGHGGIITIVVYPGHQGGAEEAAAVSEWAEALPQEHYRSMSYRFLNQVNLPPYVIAIERRA
jgi:predicted methyltransferase